MPACNRLAKSRERFGQPLRSPPASWFRQAASSAEQIVTEPYLFFSTGRTGLTVARQSMTPGVVAGANIRLETLNKLLSSQRVTAGSRLAVVDAAGRVVATDHDIALPPTNGVANEKVELPTLEAANFPVVRSLRSSLSQRTRRSGGSFGAR